MGFNTVLLSEEVMRPFLLWAACQPGCTIEGDNYFANQAPGVACACVCVCVSVCVINICNVHMLKSLPNLDGPVLFPK